MKCVQATVSRIITYSCVDGPGNRLVIFLQGCNFSCLNCHNPHTMNFCNDCGECVSSCHANALALVDGKMVFDPVACDQCDDCLKACPINANPMVATYSVPDVLELLREHRHFISGVTISGGEATLQLEFIVALFSAIKSDAELNGLSCFVDSNGHLGEGSWRKLLPVTDGVMLDIKAFDPAIHRTLTGRTNDKSLRSAQLVQLAGKLYELRFLLIPGMTDDRAEIEHLIDFVKELGDGVRVKLNAFQHHGVRGEAMSWDKMQKEDVDQIALKLNRAGIENVVKPAVYI